MRPHVRATPGKHGLIMWRDKVRVLVLALALLLLTGVADAGVDPPAPYAYPPGPGLGSAECTVILDQQVVAYPMPPHGTLFDIRFLCWAEELPPEDLGD